jgi:RNA polymerase-binding protein DksA
VARKRNKASRKQVSSTRTKKRSLTAADRKHFKQLLLEKRREILRNVTEFEDEALKKSRLDATGDLSSMPIHMADIGTDNYEQEFALGLMDSERKLLREIDDAMGRIEQRTYGICIGTGKPIPKARLEAQPWARYCVEYARMLEQGHIAEQEE